MRAEPVPHQLLKTERLPQQLQRTVQSDIRFVTVFREAAPFLVGRALTKPLAGRLVHQRSLLVSLRDPKPCARLPELRQSISVKVRGASNQQVVVQCVKRGDWKQPGLARLLSRGSIIGAVGRLVKWGGASQEGSTPA